MVRDSLGEGDHHDSGVDEVKVFNIDALSVSVEVPEALPSNRRVVPVHRRYHVDARLVTRATPRLVANKLEIGHQLPWRYVRTLGGIARQ